MDRKSITFEQAEGVAPMPSQLEPKEISRELRALLWGAMYNSLRAHTDKNAYGTLLIKGNWHSILRDKHIFRDHKMVDEFTVLAQPNIDALKAVYNYGEYTDVLGLTEWILRHKECPKGLSQTIQFALEHGRAAYRLVDGDTIVPIATEEEANALRQAINDVATSEFKGAQTHLKNAASALTAGRPADSVRESISAVESVARVLAPSAKLSDALAALEAKANMHGSMRKGFTALYGYASDEKGVRHALLDEGDAKVDEADALFMIGACAAFVSYMIAKGRAAGILKS